MQKVLKDVQRRKIESHHLSSEGGDDRCVGVPRIVQPDEPQAKRPERKEQVHEASEAVNVATEDGKQEVTPAGEMEGWID